MALPEKDCSWDVSTSFCQWADLFAETMKERQISFADWYELLTAPLDNSFGAEYEEVIVRLVYGVQHGIVKVVEKPAVNTSLVTSRKRSDSTHQLISKP